MDISEDRYSRGPDFSLLEEVASEAFMPLAYGGGIRNLDDAKRIFRIGFEKMILNRVFAEGRLFGYLVHRALLHRLISRNPCWEDMQYIQIQGRPL